MQQPAKTTSETKFMRFPWVPLPSRHDLGYRRGDELMLPPRIETNFAFCAFFYSGRESIRND